MHWLFALPPTPHPAPIAMSCHKLKSPVSLPKPGFLVPSQQTQLLHRRLFGFFSINIVNTECAFRFSIEQNFGKKSSRACQVFAPFFKSQIARKKGNIVTQKMTVKLLRDSPPIEASERSRDDPIRNFTETIRSMDFSGLTTPSAGIQNRANWSVANGCPRVILDQNSTSKAIA